MKYTPTYKRECLCTLEIKGAAYEDLMGILWSNGYETVIVTPSKEMTEDQDFRNITRSIAVYKVTEE